MSSFVKAISDVLDMHMAKNGALLKIWTTSGLMDLVWATEVTADGTLLVTRYNKAVTYFNVSTIVAFRDVTDEAGFVDSWSEENIPNA